MNKTHIIKDFTNKRITIEHNFNAHRNKVWEAWTNGNKLEKWWGPKTWPATSKEMDFREGVHWHYYMTGPDGSKAWGWIDYEEIDPQNSFNGIDAFSDEAGNKNTSLPRTHWHVEFKEQDQETKVKVTLTFTSEADMKKLIEMGFEAGFSDALDNLDRLFA